MVLGRKYSEIISVREMSFDLLKGPPLLSPFDNPKISLPPKNHIRMTQNGRSPATERTSSYRPSIGTKNEIPERLQDKFGVVCTRDNEHLLALGAGGASPVLYCWHGSRLLLKPGNCTAFALFLASSVVCFSLNTAFHTLWSHSYHVHHFWGKMDILGISIFALGGGTSIAYYRYITLQPDLAGTIGLLTPVRLSLP